MTCAPGMSVANTAVPEASAALSRRTSAGAPSAMTMATGLTANRLPSIWNSSACSNAARGAISWLPRTWKRLGWMRWRWPTSAATPALSRSICASSDRTRRCCSVACSGTKSRNTRLTGLPSGASNGTGCARRTKAPTASLSPLILPCGMATPCPSPVEPRRSRANRLSNTRLLATPWLFSNRSPACSNMRFLLVTSRSRRMFEGGRSFAMRFIEALEILPAETAPGGPERRGILHQRLIRSIRGGMMLERIVRMRMQTVFVLDDLAIEFVRHRVDRGVQIRVVALGDDVFAGDVTADFRLSCETVHGEDHADVDDVIEMAPDPGELILDVAAYRRCDRHVMPADDEIHARRPFASKRLSHADRRNLQRLPVLGDGATRDHDPLLAEDIGDLAVRKRLSGVLCSHQLLDQRPDGGGGARASRLGGDVTPEEVLELENAARRKHEFLSRYARDGRFVQAERVCDFAQNQRPHADLAVLEKMALAVDYCLRHAQDRLEALLHVLDQPACFLQLMRELAAGLTAIVLQDICIHAVDAQLRQRVGVEARHPDILCFLHYDVGDDIARLAGGERGAGTRVEALDQSLGRSQLVVADLQRFLEPCKVARREKLEVLVRDGEGRGAARRGLGQREELQLETLRAIARTHARGVQVLQMPESDVQLLGPDLQLLRHELRQLLQGLREIAVFVQRFDQERDQVAVARFELGQGELPVQVLAQAGGLGGDLEKIVVVGVVAGARARTAFSPPVEISRERVRLR